MLIGEYSSPLGEKNRLALPKRLRDELNDQLVITRGYERCLILVDQARWQALITDINSRPLLNLTVRDTKRYLLGGAQTLELDKQGRFVLPESLLEFAHIGTEVTFVAVGEWIEIWDKEKWQAKLNYLSEHAADVADKLASLEVEKSKS